MPLQRSESSSCRPLHRGFSPQWTFPMGARLPPHGAAVRGRTQNFLPGSWLKILWPVHLTLDRWNGRGFTSAPRKVHSGKQAAGVAAGGRTAAPSGAVSSHTVRCAGSAGHGADRGGATGTVAASRVFTHRTVAAARNRASGFGGDWRVRQQLPVGVGPDDRMPPGSREPKGRMCKKVL
uniref:Uncharacterized protein n=1 Tax=Escherichia coli TaxID=562 RepID=A0A7M3PQL8_ECOLX|nr:Uncharacterised protein [Escherichia coli]